MTLRGGVSACHALISFEFNGGYMFRQITTVEIETLIRRQISEKAN
jgi:hypothetical protein